MKRVDEKSHEHILFVRLPTNRSNHRGIPRTKVERTTSLRLIHTYGVEDPAGLRRPELGDSGVKRREEQQFESMEIGSTREGERGGSPGARLASQVHLLGGAPLLYL